MIKNLLILLLIMTGIVDDEVLAQNKTIVKKNKIKSITTYDVAGQKKIIDEKVVYDQFGEVVEEFSYNKEGKLKSLHKYKRSANGDVIEEIEYDENNKLKEKKVFSYNEHAEKIEELFYDAANKLVKKNSFTYNENNLKVERKTFDEKGKLKSVRLFIYEYLP